MSRRWRADDSVAQLELKRREVNAALQPACRDEPFRFQGHRLHNDFGPSYGFASLGDWYGQNATGFRWPERV